jgi:hypothetical protein
MLACANLGALQPGRPLVVIAPTTQDVFQLAVSHKNQLEFDLVTLQQLPLEDDTSNDLPLPLAVYRDLIWLMGPPTPPRPAIIGRALHELKAFDMDRKKSTLEIFQRILSAGPEHLSEKTTGWLEDVHGNRMSASKAGKKLASPLNQRMAYLANQNLAALAPGSGAYLTEKGSSTFGGWPDWKLSAKPPEPPKRKLRKLDTSTEPSAEPT